MTIEEAKRIIGLAAGQDLTSAIPELGHRRALMMEALSQASHAAERMRLKHELAKYDEAIGCVARYEFHVIRTEHAPVAGRAATKPVESVEAWSPAPILSEGVVKELPPLQAPEVSGIPATEPAEHCLELASESCEGSSEIPGSCSPPSEQRGAATATLSEPAPLQRMPEPWGETGTGKPRRPLAKVVALVMLLCVLSGVGYFLVKRSLDEQRRQREIVFLHQLADRLLEQERWEEATKAFLRLDNIDPGKGLFADGKERIFEGQKATRESFLQPLAKRMREAFEAGEFKRAEEAARKILERYPEERETRDFQRHILDAWENSLTTRAREEISLRKWKAAEMTMAELGRTFPESPLPMQLRRAVRAGRDKEQQERARAQELAAAARLRDNGEFDAEALKWIKEAHQLAPDDAEITALFEKISAYRQTIRVPEDVATLAAALELARDNDRILMSEGEFEGGLTINRKLQIDGATGGKSVLISGADEAPVLTFGPRATGSSVSHLVFRARDFDQGMRRFPVVQVIGSEVDFDACEFHDASGCGLEVIGGGHGRAAHCRFERSGWDGVCARQAGSRATATECLITGNYGNGVQAWDGGLVKILKCKLSDNVRNGILLDSATPGLELTGNEIVANREYGIVLGAGASGQVSENTVSRNMLGGMVVRLAAIGVGVSGNKITRNEGEGLILEEGLRADMYQDNVLSGNGVQELRAGVEFEAEDSGRLDPPEAGE